MAAERERVFLAKRLLSFSRIGGINTSMIAGACSAERSMEDSGTGSGIFSSSCAIPKICSPRASEPEYECFRELSEDEAMKIVKAS